MGEEIFTESEEEVLNAVHEINLAHGPATPQNIRHKIGTTRFESGETPMVTRLFLGLSHFFFKNSQAKSDDKEIEDREPSTARLYLTLIRLEKGGFLRSREITGTPRMSRKKRLQNLNILRNLSANSPNSALRITSLKDSATGNTS